jgi:hypothetical protein
MATFKRKERQPYGEVLAQRANHTAVRLVAEDVLGTAQAPDAEPVILEVLQETAKESFKAGIEVGMKKAGQPAQRPKQATPAAKRA